MQPIDFSRYRLSDLPAYAKLFVGVFTALMVLVCLWAVWIFYEDQGKIEEGTLPPYLRTDIDQPRDQATVNEELNEDLAEIAADSAAVQAPVWDSLSAGQERYIDSAEVARIARLAIEQQQALDLRDESVRESKFRHNLGLAHTHVNGQTLLYFAMGLVFLFTSYAAKLKKLVFWFFGICVALHAIGLTGEGYGAFYDDILAVSGVVLLLIILYMALLVFVDLARKPRTV